AALERGLDLRVEEVRELLTGAAAPRAIRQALLDPDFRGKTLREVGAELAPELRAAAMLAGHKSGLKGRTWDRDDVLDAAGREGIEFYNHHLDASVRMPGDRRGLALDSDEDPLDEYLFRISGGRVH